jgi:hypothetical protein
MKIPPKARQPERPKNGDDMAEIYWHLPLLIVVISLVYSGTRYDSWTSIFAEAVRWGLRMFGFLAGIALVLFVLTHIIPNARGIFG